MSFSADLKTELCKVPIPKSCCALAELYGILLFASVFSAHEIRIITRNDRLKRRVAQLGAAISPPLKLTPIVAAASGGRQSLTIADKAQLSALMRLLGYDEDGFLKLHFNGWIVEEDCCRMAFLRGAFLTGGYLAEPEKRYYLELSTTHEALMRELSVLFSELNLGLRAGHRKENCLLYCKDGETIETYLTMAGAHKSVIEFMEMRVIKDVRNTINRRVNCEASNIMKAAETGSYQLSMLRRLDAAGMTADLDEKLRAAMELRMAYPDEPLAELAAKADPPISKSGLNHRLQKLVAMAETLPPAEDEEPEDDE
ncbi:MAG: DNA-binding protein WhiA [Ruminococcaceae bacterium]|nr:DNA-binding protein WhiA [Oscillospiraceae bacterium]